MVSLKKLLFFYKRTAAVRHDLLFFDPRCEKKL